MALLDWIVIALFFVALMYGAKNKTTRPTIFSAAKTPRG